jgi:hypothetical protein
VHVLSRLHVERLIRGRVRMADLDTLSHTTWDCKYPVVLMFCRTF